MKKDEVIILSCSKCGAMSHAIKNPKMPDGYRVKEAEYVICKICFGELKWFVRNVAKSFYGKEWLLTRESKKESIIFNAGTGMKKNVSDIWN